MEGANGALFGKLLGGGALSGEIEHKDLELAQKLPDGFIIVGRSGVMQMRSESPHESAHVVVSRTGPLYSAKEGRRG